MASSRPSWIIAVVGRVTTIQIFVLCCFFLANLQPNGQYTVLAMSNADFHVAPMQCYTNLPFRKLCSTLSPTSTYWTEMEKADDLLPHVQSALMQRLGDPRESFDQSNSEQQHKLVLQLGSNDPQKVQECVQAAMGLEYEHLKEINLNCGCPAIDSGGAPTYGASLMKDPSLAASLVDACRRCVEQKDGGQSSASLDVSVKCRIGLVDHASDLSPSDSTSSLASLAYDYDRLHHFVTKIQEAGANHVILHARPAVLSGLSPVQNRIVPTLDYDMVRQVANDFPELKVTLNGGISSLSQLAAEYEKGDDRAIISSFMAGRWILQRPLDLIGIERWLVKNRDQQVPSADMMKSPALDENSKDAFAIAKGALEDYLDYSMKCATHEKSTMARTTSDLCLPLFLVIEQLREDYDDDDDGMESYGSLDRNYDDDQSESATVSKESPMLSYEEMESLYDLLQEGVTELNDCIGKGGKSKKTKKNSSVNFKRLSSSFKSLVGTKVANKWKRNRAEL